jgi:hypothetical protein
MHYPHAQVATYILLACGTALAFIAVGRAMSGFCTEAALPMGIFTVLIAPVFSSLTVEIMDRTVLCFFGPDIIRRSIPLSTIVEVRSVTNPSARRRGEFVGGHFSTGSGTHPVALTWN